ncbi:universal stress protein [uncultured Phenylobacterium sp.]|uniref:universal stress protein n=1 Tax=uncultured Phenylobacterium sp. TaxID=349273 RepID=UPI0025EFDC45|nr:universal stress protein [uncultured Phenylobacterium sp.]
MSPLVGPVIACVDGSAHTGGVCGAASWLAERMEAGVELLHLEDDAPQTRRPGGSGPVADRDVRWAQVIDKAASDVVQAGAQLTEILTGRGAFLDAATRVSRRAGMLVVGRRGLSSPPYSLRLGAHVGAILRSAECPVCLTPESVAPPRQALVLLDANHAVEAMTEFLAGHPALDGLPCEVAAFGTTRRGLRPGLRPLAEHPHQALESFLRERDCDVVVLPRAALLGDPRRREFEGLLSELNVTALLPGRGRLRIPGF